MLDALLTKEQVGGQIVARANVQSVALYNIDRTGDWLRRWIERWMYKGR